MITIKISIALNKLLQQNKSANKTNVSINSKKLSKQDVTSYEKIALNSDIDLRKATVTAAFSGKTKSEAFTIIQIVESMGYNMRDFGEKYDSVTDEEIMQFKESKKKKS